VDVIGTFFWLGGVGLILGAILALRLQGSALYAGIVTVSIAIVVIAAWRAMDQSAGELREPFAAIWAAANVLGLVAAAALVRVAGRRR